ncbi:TRAP transporter small permease subunit [Halomonas organivorans]|uniref:TRAP transporter small permease protein n=1 Tax=Halomonas organivorans TaxID=257772 RepID=A0A7W5BWC9_9GAMM|nr:TRAP transporter small permease subunit [Halomonas organivorans]MBB3139868.1 TRAP-type mannitol/chloroaromatic compound transport system permease small subunit [Halomonas organivorans]
MRALLKISDGIDALLNGLSKVASFALLGLIVVVVFDVTTRRLFQMGSTQLQEGEWHLHTILIMCFLGVTYIHNQHVRVDLVSGTFSSKGRELVELLGILLLLLPFCAVTGYYATDFAYTSFVRNEVSQSIDGLPYRWAIKSMLPLGIYLLALAGVSRGIRALVALIDPKPADLVAEEKGGV